jgi:hypothetical protein
VYPLGAVHAWPHEPQLSTSLVTFTHAPLQLFSPEAQHVPDTHAEPWRHVFVQLPQCAALLFKSTHVVPHLVFPDGQSSRQLPPKQI